MVKRKFIYIDCPLCKGHQGYITLTNKVRCFTCGLYIEDTQKELKKKFEAEIEATTTFDPDRFFRLIMGLTQLRERKLLPEEDIEELREKLKKRMSEVV
jgi:Zn ribbon nucleic-acid-binding protein